MRLALHTFSEQSEHIFLCFLNQSETDRKPLIFLLAASQAIQQNVGTTPLKWFLKVNQKDGQLYLTVNDFQFPNNTMAEVMRGRRSVGHGGKIPLIPVQPVWGGPFNILILFSSG